MSFKIIDTYEEPMPPYMRELIKRVEVLEKTIAELKKAFDKEKNL